MNEFKITEIDEEAFFHIENHGGFDNLDLRKSLEDFTFHEYTLSDLGLPDPDQLLKSVINIEKQVGLVGWRSNQVESKTYKGFSLTYNPDFCNPQESIYHQTWGSNDLSQSFARELGTGNIVNTKNTYYDSYAFRKIPPIVENELGYLLDKFSMPLFRSRVAYNYGYGSGIRKQENWHKDEFPYSLMRINIPLQTSIEHVIDIEGEDDYGTKLSISNKFLETEKLYLWNTRIPHRVTLSKLCLNSTPRIHIVLGFSPWFEYDPKLDSIRKGPFWGVPISTIVKEKLFLKNR
jgi:hypothetical protein